MKAKYILRLDDAHEKMNYEGWRGFEELCDKYGIRPLVAIIPKNLDNNINFVNSGKENIEYYDSVISRWKKKGWLFALHGCHHKLHKNPTKSLVDINNYSEFVGLDYNVQKELIINGIHLLKRHSINPCVWIAPAHGFDKNTLSVLKDHTNIKIISDGIRCHPFKKNNLKWIPAQLWKPRKLPLGTWTICYHPSTTTSSNFQLISNFIKENHDSFITLDDIEEYNTAIRFEDILLKIVFKLKKVFK